MLSLRILFLVVLAVSKQYDENMEPTYTALDLNVTIHWQHPDVNRPEIEEILYTVIYYRSTEYRDLVKAPVPSCVNITRTVCCLVEMFPSGTFNMNEYFHVDYLSSTRPMVHGRSKRKAFNRYYVDVSAPTICDTAITSRNITVWVQGPATPFFKNGRQRLMGERGLGGELDRAKLRIDYRSTITNLDDTTKKPLKTDWMQSAYGELDITHTSLDPHTQYRIGIRSKYYEPSKNVTWTVLKTEQEAPEFGPMIIGTSAQRRSCDARDIQVSWKESSYQRGSVDIHNYTVTFVSSESNELTSVVVPSDTFSSVTRNLNRWGEYTVNVTSINSKGSKTGYGSLVTKDEHDEDSYKPTGMEITRVSLRLWGLTWVPSADHQQCTIGYEVKTSIDGSQEEAVIVDGYNASSATFNFRKVGRYNVDLSPIILDSVLTKVSVTIDYDVKDWKIREWAILTSVMILLVLMLVAVVIMSKKVCCDLDTLPDISKSRPMRIASRNGGYIPSLKPPPEKETFNKTRRPITEIKILTPEDDPYSDDDVFESKLSYSDSSAPLPDWTSLNNPSTFANDRISPSEDDGTCSVKVPGDNIPTQTPPDSYVSAASTYKIKPNFSVHLPNEHTTIPKLGTLSTQSSDSGISSTAYGGSFSDYVPPSPFSDSSHGDDLCGYRFETDSPYVASALAGRSGRIPSTSSEPEDEGMGYRRIDSRRLDGHPGGYLPMIPASPVKVNAKISANEDPFSDSELKDV